jgi:hypothetical protein
MRRDGVELFLDRKITMKREHFRVRLPGESFLTLSDFARARQKNENVTFVRQGGPHRSSHLDSERAFV